MRHPTITKERILRFSGRLFNTQGYKATSISDITSATGLTKGAIYRHFKNKDELEGDTLRHLSQIMFDKLKARIRMGKTASEKLRAIFRYFESYISRPPMEGGCPLLNVSIEADDNNPELRKQATLMLDLQQESIVRILTNGIRYGQLRKDINKEHYATIIIASLEGAIMMSKLRGNNVDIKRTIRHLEKLVTEIEL